MSDMGFTGSTNNAKRAANQQRYAKCTNVSPLIGHGERRQTCRAQTTGVPRSAGFSGHGRVYGHVFDGFPSRDRVRHEHRGYHENDHARFQSQTFLANPAKHELSLNWVKRSYSISDIEIGSRYGCHVCQF